MIKSRKRVSVPKSGPIFLRKHWHECAHLHDVNWHGRDVFIGLDDLAGTHQQVLHAAIGVSNDLLYGRFQTNVATYPPEHKRLVGQSVSRPVGQWFIVIVMVMLMAGVIVDDLMVGEARLTLKRLFFVQSAFIPLAVM
jgi:hypothetical protein